MTESQTSQILRWLEAGQTITPILALNRFGCFRLGARILDLRKVGYPIETTMIPTVTGKRIAEYRLAP